MGIPRGPLSMSNWLLPPFSHYLKEPSSFLTRPNTFSGRWRAVNTISVNHFYQSDMAGENKSWFRLCRGQGRQGWVVIYVPEVLCFYKPFDPTISIPRISYLFIYLIKIYIYIAYVGTVLSALKKTHLIFRTISWARHYYFTAEEKETQRGLSKLPMATS